MFSFVKQYQNNFPGGLAATLDSCLKIAKELSKAYAGWLYLAMLQDPLAFFQQIFRVTDRFSERLSKTITVTNTR